MPFRLLAYQQCIGETIDILKYDFIYVHEFLSKLKNVFRYPNGAKKLRGERKNEKITIIAMKGYLYTDICFLNHPIMKRSTKLSKSRAMP